jgi:hypothetical protein
MKGKDTSDQVEHQSAFDAPVIGQGYPTNPQQCHCPYHQIDSIKPGKESLVSVKK